MKSKLLILLLILPFFVDAQQPMKDIPSFRKQFTAASQKITSIESSFTQEKDLSAISEKITSKGKFYFKKENKLRWEYSEPFIYLFIMNNGKAYVKDEGKQNTFDVRSNKMFAEVNSILMGSVQGTLLDDEKRFSSTYFESSSAYIVKLKPKAAKLASYLKEIIIYFDKKDLSVSRLDMNEPAGDYTRIDFTGKKLNTLSNDEKFLIP